MSRRERLLFLGDVYLDATPAEIRLAELAPFTFNLEAPLTARGRLHPGKVNLRMPPEALAQAFPVRPVAVCLANNHILDGGAEGLEDTLRLLEGERIAWFGAGRKDDRYGNPARVTVGETMIALCGYVCPTTHPVFAAPGDGPSCAPIEVAVIAGEIAEARRGGAARVVVQLHWGMEEVAFPRPEDIETARAIVEAGADLVIGHHAHIVQPYEIYRGCGIFYGLGNCIMPDLDVPSYADADGNPSGRFRKRQEYWNRSSIGVRWDPRTNEAEPVRLQFGRGVLEPATGRIPRLPVANRAGYERLLRRAIREARLRGLWIRWKRQPFGLRPRHLRTLARCFKR
jgi:poly-gamma-glutamate synthesis protein (capsule biosynthesis protein)